MRFPDFIPAKRADVPNYVQAEIYQNALDQQRQQYKDQQRRDNLELPAELYSMYSDVSGTEPIADAITRAKERWGSPPTNPADAPANLSTVGGPHGPNSTSITPIPRPMPSVNSGPVDGVASLGGYTTDAVNRTASLGGGGGGAIPSNAPTFMKGGQRFLSGGGGNPVALPTTNVINPGVAKGGGDIAASLAANASQAGDVANAANSGINAASKVLPAVSKALPIAGAVAAPAITAYSGGTNAEIAKSGIGAASTAALSTFGAPMAAAGPIGWAGIAALSAASLYGMFA